MPLHNIYNIVYIKDFGKLDAIKYTWMILLACIKGWTVHVPPWKQVAPGRKGDFPLSVSFFCLIVIYY